MSELEPVLTSKKTICVKASRLMPSGREEPFELVPLAYDHQRLAREMRAERLPDEFVETVLEVLPAKERYRSTATPCQKAT